MFWKYYHIIENSALPKTLSLLFLTYIGVTKSYFTPPNPPPNYCLSLTVMQPFFFSEYLLKYLVPELWNVDKSTLTWLSYFLSRIFLTHILAQSINARWQLHFDTLNIYQVMWCAFKVFFYPFHQMSWLIPHSFIPAFSKLHF